jgi:hypothetical protein
MQAPMATRSCLSFFGDTRAERFKPDDAVAG